VVRVCSDDRESIRFAIRGADLKLRSVVLRRASLRRLQSDPARDVKVEHLQRELIEAASRRREFQYPRAVRLSPGIAIRRLAAAAF
jgi:hypothetical protein